MNITSTFTKTYCKFKALAKEIWLKRRPGLYFSGDTEEKKLLLASPVHILFISHDFALAGAQKVLLSIVRWLHRHAYGVEFSVLELPNTSEDVLRRSFEKCCKVFTWNELSSNGLLDPDLVRKHVGKLDIIYCNTVVCGYKIEECLKIGVPIVSHIHELEQSIQRFASTECIIAIRENSALTIPVSPPVYENLLNRHKFPQEKLRLVYPFIEDAARDYGRLTDEQRGFLKRIKDPDSFVVFGCGTPDWRKGTDIFIRVAAHLNLLRPKKFLFVWVGDFTKDLESDRRQFGVEEQVIFFGRSENPGALFRLGDVFCLSSREDPYPLVALEGARERLPVICFENSGGIPGFVRNHQAGMVCAYESVEEMAENILRLCYDSGLREKYGENGKSAMEKWHSADVTVPELILHSIGVVLERKCHVSILLPVNDDDNYVERRLQNLLTQSYSNFELIILDNTSTDKFKWRFSRYLNDRRVSIIATGGQSGNFALQLIRGLRISTGEFIWVAKTDSIATRNFLEIMLQSLSAQGRKFAFCKAGIQGENEDSAVTNNYRSWPEIISRLTTDELHPIVEQEEKCAFRKFVDATGPLDSCVFKRVEVEPIEAELSRYHKLGSLFFFVSLFLVGDPLHIPEVLTFCPVEDEGSVPDLTEDDFIKEIESIKELAANRSSLLTSLKERGKINGVVGQDIYSQR